MGNTIDFNDPKNDDKAYDFVVHFKDFFSLSENEGVGLSFSPIVHEKIFELLEHKKLLPKEGKDIEIPEDCYNLLTLNEDFSVVLVLGLFDKGKTWLLNKLCNVGLPSGETVHTEGLSFKLPRGIKGADSNIILLDTAGSHSPIKDVSKESIGLKKAFEHFLTELALSLSDVIFIVVNEITWPDQEFIEGLMTSFQNNGEISRNLVIIHNFKNTETKNDLNEKLSTYILKCYRVNKRTQGFEELDHYAEWYQDAKESRISHVFLAKEGSEAGNLYNPANIRLLQSWMLKIIQKRNSLLSRIITTSSSLISQQISGIERIKLYASDRAIYNENLKSYPFLLKGIKSEDVSRATDIPQLLKTVQYMNGSFQLQFINREVETFKPQMDCVIKEYQDLTNNKRRRMLIVIFDLPGTQLKTRSITETSQTSEKSTPKTINEVAYNDAKIETSIDILTSELIVKSSHRKLFHRKYTIDNGQVIMDANEKESYLDSEIYQINRRRSTSTEWTQKIKLPVGFEKRISKNSVRDGIVEIVILDEQPDDQVPAWD